MTAVEVTRRDRRELNMLAIAGELNRQGEIATSDFEGHYSHMSSHPYIE
jgi:hypothetical protein